MSIITTRVECLKAVFPFGSKEETRYYLNGVYAESGLLVATDGHRLAAIKPALMESQGAGFIIPSATIKQVLSIKAGKREELFCEFNTETGVATVYTLDRDKNRDSKGAFPFKPIDGTFPEWRRVIPAAENFNTANHKDRNQNTGAGFNSAYLATFQAFGDKVNVFLNNDPGAPSLVTAKTELFEAVGVIMPMRSYELTAVLPEWIKATPTPPAALDSETVKESESVM